MIKNDDAKISIASTKSSRFEGQMMNGKNNVNDNVNDNVNENDFDNQDN